MKKRTVFIIGVLTILAGSCIPSLFPLYTQDDIVFDDDIFGVWDGGDKGVWTIEKLVHKSSSSFWALNTTEVIEESDTANFNYKLTVRQIIEEDTVKAEFIVHLLELGEFMYMNIYPYDYDLHHGFLSWHMIEAHTFMRIELFDDRFEIRAFDPGFLEDLIRENKIRISHISQGGILITAPTEDLQKFVLKYSDEEGALFDPDIFRKI